MITGLLGLHLDLSELAKHMVVVHGDDWMQIYPAGANSLGRSDETGGRTNARRLRSAEASRETACRIPRRTERQLHLWQREEVQEVLREVGMHGMMAMAAMAVLMAHRPSQPKTPEEIEEAKKEAEARRLEYERNRRGIRVTRNPGRNEACRCGSGRKFKKCCGK